MLRFPSAPALCLDFDGCLVDLASTPDGTRVPRDLPGLLARLHRATDGALALVSGRPIADLRRFLPGVDIPMVGSHGAERVNGRGRVHVLPIDRKVLSRITQGAARIIGDTPGLLLETKPVAVGLHYRGAPQHRMRIQTAASKLVADAPGFHTHQSKMLVEIRPDGIGKGDAVAHLLKQARFRGRVPVVFGDDATDEPAFAVANARGGVSVKVGPGATAARRRLASPAEVRAALGHLARRLEQG